MACGVVQVNKRNIIRCPPAARLVEAFPQLSLEDAKRIRILAHGILSFGWDVTTNTPGVDRAIATMVPSQVATWGEVGRTVALMEFADGLLKTLGVSMIHRRRGECSTHFYCNAGDSNARTLLYTRATRTLRIGSWGQIIH